MLSIDHYMDLLNILYLLKKTKEESIEERIKVISEKYNISEKDAYALRNERRMGFVIEEIKLSGYEDQAGWWKDYGEKTRGENTSFSDRVRVIKTYMQAEKQISFCFSEGAKVLDLGCCIGWLLKWIIGRYNIKGVGVDVCLSALECLEDIKNVEVVLCDLKKLDLGETFDLIVSSYVLQHMVTGEDFDAFYRVVEKHLKIGGFFVLTDRFDGGVTYFNRLVRGFSFHERFWESMGLDSLLRLKVYPDLNVKRYSVFLKRGKNE